jgi:hypothetical protein
LIASLYTTGIFRIWSIFSKKVIAEYDLINNTFEEKLEKVNEKIVSAKIEVLTRPLSADNYTKTFEIAIAFGSMD